MTKEKLKQQYIIAKYWNNRKLSSELQQLHDEVEEYINSVDDCIVKEILYNRYILGLSWVAVANRCGYLNASEAYRKRAERYIKKNTGKLVEIPCKCSECKEWKRNVGVVDSPNGHCFYHGIQMNAYDFCSYGEPVNYGSSKNE